MCTKTALGVIDCVPNEFPSFFLLLACRHFSAATFTPGLKNNLILLRALILILYAVHTDATCGVLPIFGVNWKVAHAH